MSTGFYSQVFYEALWHGSLVPMSSEAAFYAMKSFGGYNMGIAFALAVSGSVLGQLFNWYLGHYLLEFKHSGKFKINEYWYDKVSRLFIRYGFFSLFFCWAPLCNILVVAAGFINMRLSMVMPLVIIGEIFNYALM